MKLAILLLCFLTASPACAGPGATRLLSVLASKSVPFTINGYSSITIGGVEDTGSQSITTGAGDITINASCFASTGDQVDISLIVDGVPATLSCTSGQTKTNQKLTRTVAAGSHTVSVVVSYDDPILDTGVGNSFRKPR